MRPLLTYFSAIAGGSVAGYLLTDHGCYLWFAGLHTLGVLSSWHPTRSDPMTEQAFLVALARTPRTWRYLDGGVIRNAAGQCPICAVATMEGKNPEGCREGYYGPGIQLNLDANFMHDAAAAADFERGRLRDSISLACGL